MPTIAQLDSFEHGIAASGTGGVYDQVGGTPSITTSNPRTGSRCLNLNPSGAIMHVSYTVAATIVTQSVYIRFNSSFPSTDYEFMIFLNANGNGTVKYDNATGRFAVFAGAEADTAFGPSSLSADTWYLVDAEYDCSTGTATLLARIDGDSGTEGTSQSTQTSANVTQARLGTANTRTVDVNMDDWVISVTDGDYPLGEHEVHGLFPASDGSHNITAADIFEYSATGTDITNSSTDAYTLIDDAPMDTSFTDYINNVGNGSTQYVLCNFDTLSITPSTIWNTKALSLDRDSITTSSSACQITIRKDAGATLVATMRSGVQDPGVTPTMRKAVPLDVTATSEVNDLSIRFLGGDGTPDSWLSSALVEVALVPAAGGSQVIVVNTSTAAL